MIVLEEIKKLVRQFLGKQNVFGYRTTLANRLYLTYCIFGKIYFTNHIHRQVKYIWAIYHAIGMIVTYTLSGLFLIYDQDRNMLSVLYAISSVGMCNLCTFFIPAITFFFGDRFEATISLIDEIASKNYPSRKPNKLKSSTIYCVVFTLIALCLVVFVNILDVILFYDESKVRNNAYYAFPLPNVRTYGSLTLHLVSNITFAAVLTPIAIETAAYMIFIISWFIVCNDLLEHVSDQLHCLSKLPQVYINSTSKTSAAWKRPFQEMLVTHVRQFNIAIKLIKLFKTVFEVFFSIVMVNGTSIEVTFAYALLFVNKSADTSLPLMTRCITMELYVGWIIFTVCNIAETFEDSVSQVSFAVYSTPWYRNVSVRQDVYICLHLTQQRVDLTLAMVYPFRLSTFSKFAHTVWTIVNFLRTMTMGNGKK